MPYPVNDPQIDAPTSKMVQRVSAEYMGGYAVTPSNSVDLTTHGRALMVGVTGNVKVTMLDASVVTLYLVAGLVYPFMVKRVWSTGTTATSIVALY